MSAFFFSQWRGEVKAGCPGEKYFLSASLINNFTIFTQKNSSELDLLHNYMRSFHYWLVHVVTIIFQTGLKQKRNTYLRNWVTFCCTLSDYQKPVILVSLPHLHLINPLAFIIQLRFTGQDISTNTGWNDQWITA